MFKRTLILTALLFTTTFVTSQAHAGLKESMQSIGGEFRQIFTKSKDPALKAETLAHIQNLKAAFIAAKAQFPALVETLPPDQQGPARARYEELIQTGVVLSDELTSAVEGARANDITTILNRLNELRRTGHGEFQ